MAFHLRLQSTSEGSRSSRSGRRLLGRLTISAGLILGALVVMVVADDLLAGGRFSNLIVSDGVSGVLEWVHR